MKSGWALAAVLPFLIAGCGGEGERVLGRNSEIEIVLNTGTSAEIRDLELVIAPKEGPVDDPGACTLDDRNFCAEVDKDITRREIVYTFRTNSDASERPFFVYAVNTDLSDFVDYRMRVYIDGDLKWDRDRELPPDTVRRIGRVYRNNIAD